MTQFNPFIRDVCPICDQKLEVSSYNDFESLECSDHYRSSWCYIRTSDGVIGPSPIEANVYIPGLWSANRVTLYYYPAVLQLEAYTRVNRNGSVAFSVPGYFPVKWKSLDETFQRLLTLITFS